jgi:hypothetical protein
MNLQWIENGEINLKELNSRVKKKKIDLHDGFFPDNVIKQSIINNNRVKSNGIMVCLGLTYN